MALNFLFSDTPHRKHGIMNDCHTKHKKHNTAG
uniref:Uncharacterized protein n=1 Tax=Anguilla anguilla TaxID=7936 RepID=A0A0E9TQT2_ANGAN